MIYFSHFYQLCIYTQQYCSETNYNNIHLRTVHINVYAYSLNMYLMLSNNYRRATNSRRMTADIFSTQYNVLYKKNQPYFRITLCCILWSRIDWFRKFSVFMARQPPVGLGLLIVEVSGSHSVRHTTLRRTPLDEWSGRRRYLYKHTTLTRDRHPLSRKGSNPQSEQWSGGGPTR
jgi:hypothetical protein